MECRGTTTSLSSSSCCSVSIRTGSTRRGTPTLAWLRTRCCLRIQQREVRLPQEEQLLQQQEELSLQQVEPTVRPQARPQIPQQPLERRTQLAPPQQPTPPHQPTLPPVPVVFWTLSSISSCRTPATANKPTSHRGATHSSGSLRVVNLS